MNLKPIIDEVARDISELQDILKALHALEKRRGGGRTAGAGQNGFAEGAGGNAAEVTSSDGTKPRRPGSVRSPVAGGSGSAAGALLKRSLEDCALANYKPRATAPAARDRKPLTLPRRAPKAFPAGDAIREAVRQAVGEFRARQISKLSGRPVKQVANWFVNAVDRGELKGTGHGVYEKTPKFHDPKAGERLLEEIHNEIASGNGSSTGEH